ncbi:MAG: hypothetical protein LBR10_06640 [Prevotellaceae bacterium]|jgi:hypothetical protein|nr:hypothetical protein [Prevotellaceae bacterium]
MFQYIKNIFRKQCLKTALARMAQRKVVAHNFATTKTMGVMLPFNVEIDEILGTFKKIAKENKTEVIFIIYFPQEKLPEDVRSTYSKIMFSDQECNWFGKPAMMEITDFINKKFDILIDLSSKIWFPLQYIAISSKADFKIGRINEEINPYDFLLLGCDTEKQFINELETYLHKIK